MSTRSAHADPWLTPGGRSRRDPGPQCWTTFGAQRRRALAAADALRGVAPEAPEIRRRGSGARDRDPPTRAALGHAATGARPQPPTLDKRQWDDLVGRLTESTRQKEVRLLRSQMQKLAEEISGWDFKPRLTKFKLRAPRKPLYPGAEEAQCVRLAARSGGVSRVESLTCARAEQAPREAAAGAAVPA